MKKLKYLLLSLLLVPITSKADVISDISETSNNSQIFIFIGILFTAILVTVVITILKSRKDKK